MRRHYNIRHAGQASLSEGQILAELREVEVSVVRDNTTKRHYAIPAAASSTKIRHYKAMGLTVPMAKDPDPSTNKTDRLLPPRAARRLQM
ncbi:MAG: hypothetical protein OXU68_15215 [Bacteroidota bacterium]|nr:hypothetical protein [Bacteroidota bacterium]